MGENAQRITMPTGFDDAIAGSKPVRPVHCVQFTIHLVKKTLDLVPFVGTGMLLQTAE